MSKPKLDGEARVSRYLNFLGLKPERYTKAEMRASRTPDFKVYSGDSLAFYCEVKTAQEDTWLKDLLEIAEPGMLVGGTRDDPTYSRIASYIHDSVGQFDAVNPSMVLPNVLAIVNGDEEADIEDLEIAFGSLIYSSARIADSKKRINLVIWFDGWSQDGPHFFAPGAHEGHTLSLARYLPIDLKAIQRYPYR
jgi:hypothetical protein